jgi:hypothetical protein
MKLNRTLAGSMIWFERRRRLLKLTDE